MFNAGAGRKLIMKMQKRGWIYDFAGACCGKIQFGDGSCHLIRFSNWGRVKKFLDGKIKLPFEPLRLIQDV